MIKAVVLDMDGLMFDTERIAIPAWIHAGKCLGYNITESMVLKTFGLNSEYTKRFWQNSFGLDFNFDLALSYRNQYAEDIINKNGISVKKGLLELLNYLKENNYKFTVATSSDKIKAEKYFKMANIDSFLGRIITGDMIKNGKPEPDMYIKATELLRVFPDECLAIEDSSIGILSAHRAGLKPVMIPDIIPADKDIKELLFAELNSLLDVIDLIEDFNR